MKQVSGKEFVKLLERHGWRLLRINGSHHIMGKEGRIERLSIPVHRNEPLKTGLIRHQMKVAGLQETDL